MVRTLRHGKDIRVRGSNGWEDSRIIGHYLVTPLIRVIPLHVQTSLGLSQQECDNRWGPDDSKSYFRVCRVSSGFSAGE